MKLSEKSQVTADLKSIGIIIAMVVSVSSTYFTLKADIDANRKALENGNWVSSTEYQLKDELVRTTIMSNSKKLDAIENKLNTIDNRLYNLNK
jgi:hypothetical protein|tara:strand:- start:815 stop:1093 length:279 start_codon:yes stop_codon:yes gene_type:complete